MNIKVYFSTTDQMNHEHKTPIYMIVYKKYAALKKPSSRRRYSNIKLNNCEERKQKYSKKPKNAVFLA